ncbi:MAG: 5-oxoprolinase subunit PxpA [Planctomycetota bacterium]|nr:LamB/YcsF family protein [Planctomycetota bacterium]RLS24874.1 MAG: LamB/YcsF family protein [Planctomycetota bacterium]RLT15613.1 MAG: LamB/YcsF family protein [Planctomycetota bacterium]
MPLNRKRFDLNADLGEGCGQDEGLMPLVSSASIATGAYAGDDSTALAAILMARQHAVVVGAHPGFPDFENFGRVAQEMSAGEVERMVIEQCRHLQRLAGAVGVFLPYLKPHGALYHQTLMQPTYALGVVRAAARLSMALMIQPVGVVVGIAQSHGVSLVREGFLDRRYNADGTLVARSRPNAMLTDPDEIRDQLVHLIDNRMIDSLCIHGDSPHACQLARWVHGWADELGYEIRSVWQRVD